MVFLKSLSSKPGLARRSGFPFDLPLVRSLEKLEFQTPVTFFVGENGSGKSTLLEAVAVACDSVAIGGDDLGRDASLAHARALAAELQLSWGVRTRKGFFLRSEDFFRFVKRTQQAGRELQDLEDEFSEKYEGYARTLAVGAARGQRRALESRYGGDLDARSHGESFLTLFQSRLVPGGLYILDEPEVALSPQRQLAFMALLLDMVKENCQFLVATHSPILMALPGATLWNVDERPPRAVDFEELEHVRFTRDFLQRPSRYLDRL